MWKNSKAVVRNIIIYFIPFVVMALVAVFFLHHSFILMEKQNMSIMKAQMQNVLDDMEENLAYSMDIAKDMCIDSALRRKNMEGNDTYTVSGISKMLTYKTRMKMCSSLFLNYQPERMITEMGTCSIEIYTRDQLELSESGEAQFYNMLEQEETFSSGILQKKTGENYLLFLYYFPESLHLEEQRIGFLIDIEQLNKEVAQILAEVNSFAVMQINDQLITAVNCLSEKTSDEAFEKMLVQLKDREDIKGFSTIYIKSQYLYLIMQVAVNSSELRAELVREEVKMALIGIVVFVTMSAFLWNYSKIRYQTLNEIKQFAVSHHPELNSDTKESEYSIIRKVLEKDLENLKRKDEDFDLFKKESKKQLTWLIFSSDMPNELELEVLFEAYDIPEGGPYYCVHEFLLEGKEICEDIDFSQSYKEILMQYSTVIEQGILYIVCSSLSNRDDGHEKRMQLIKSIRNDLLDSGYCCKKAASGLVYASLKEIHSSQQEALTLIQDESLWRKDKDVLFFDERAHVTKRVPHITVDLLEQFRDKLQQNEAEEANHILELLMAPPKNMAEELNIYVRYKVVSILMEVASEKDVSDTLIHDMVSLSNLESDNFEVEVKESIMQNFAQAQRKSIKISEILDYINEHYTNTEISQEMIAEHFDSNVRSIRRIMKREIDKTYKEYLNEIRVNKACELLEKSDMSIQQISKQVGCYEVASFYRVFKKVMGMTPDEYRSSKKII